MSDEIKLLRKLRRRVRITWVCFFLTMVIYPLSARTIGIVPVWVFGWLASLIGWWNWCHHATPLGACLKEEIEKLTNEEQEEQA